MADLEAGGLSGYSVVVPTVGRPSLRRLLAALAEGCGPLPLEVVVVDDRKTPGGPLELGLSHLAVRVAASGGRGPAAARNVGWRLTSSPWVVFLDDDVVPAQQWPAALAEDLEGQPWQVAGSQGRLNVPLPSSRRPTDWERNTAGLATAQWATADMAYRRSVLEEVGGFDERFPRAFREDADLGLRITEAGYLIVQGSRRSDHPVRPAGAWVSIRVQAGNADDVLMRARHGAGWRLACGAEPGRNGRHLATTALAGLALVAAATSRGGLAQVDMATSHKRGALAFRNGWALAAGCAWFAATAKLAASRILPGPRSGGEIALMGITSAAIPPAAVFHLARGWCRLPSLLSDTAKAPLGRPLSPLGLRPPPLWAPADLRPRSAQADPSWQPKAILFDRDGTLVADLPGNTDPSRVAPMPGARAAIRRAREEGLAIGVVTNQSAVGRGTMSASQVEAVNYRIDDMLGPFDDWQVCMHSPAEGCGCRKPAPGLVKAAATALGVEPGSCVVIGDIGSDIDAAHAAGSRSILVPTPNTRPEEVSAAPVVASDLLRAIDYLLGGQC